MSQKDSNSNPTLRKRWESLVAITNSNPRLVEIARIAIRTTVTLDMIPTIFRYDLPSLMSDIFASIEYEIGDRYREALSFPEKRELFHIVHSRRMEMTKYSMQLVALGIITNVVTSFPCDYKS